MKDLVEYPLIRSFEHGSSDLTASAKILKLIRELSKEEEVRLGA